LNPKKARKKRRLRKKSDLSKFDLSELRKKLESVENDSTDSGGDSNGDKGFCDGSNPPSDGTVTPEKRESGGSDSGESSDSGVSTPPPADLKIEKVNLPASSNLNPNLGVSAYSFRLKRNPQAKELHLRNTQISQQNTFAKQKLGRQN